MKTIKAMQTEKLHFTQLEKGMIIAEGVILDLDPALFIYYTPSSNGLEGYWMEPYSKVAVLARITDGMVRSLQDAMADELA